MGKDAKEEDLGNEDVFLVSYLDHELRERQYFGIKTILIQLWAQTTNRVDVSCQSRRQYNR